MLSLQIIKNKILGSKLSVVFIKNNGQSIVEIIVAVSILIIIASSTVIAVLGSFTTIRLAKEQTQATYFASEGLEAVKSIKNQDWNNMINGDHGVSSASGKWAFSGVFDVSGKYTRTITVSDIYRQNGDIVQSGGTLDRDTKKIVSSIKWDFTPGSKNTVILLGYTTNWQMGNYKGPTTPEAAALTVATSSAVLTTGYKYLEGITLGNLGTPLSITIDKMKVSWTGNSGNQMTQITINGSPVCNICTQGVVSGTTVDITNVILPSGSTNIPINRITFNKNMRGSVFEIVFYMIDNSYKTIQGINPL